MPSSRSTGSIPKSFLFRCLALVASAVLSLPLRAAYTDADADRLFDAYNAAFYQSQTNGRAYYKENTDGGRKVGTMLQELFDIEGLESRRVGSNAFADHLVVSSAWTTIGQSPIAMVGHLDTVFPPGTFEGFKRDGDLAVGLAGRDVAQHLRLARGQWGREARTRCRG